MSEYYINNSEDSWREFEVENIHLKNSNSKNKKFFDIYQSRTTEDTGTYKSINYQAKINDILKDKYTTTTEFYNAKVVHDIMYNETVQIVSVFKDYLILDDLTEFFKRPYSLEESYQKLPRQIKFYESYSNAVPNYAVLPENKYLFKNIAKKQKAAEDKHRYLMFQKTQKRPTEEEHARMMNSIMSEEKLFDYKFIEEVKEQKYLPDIKNYKKMKLSRILDTFIQNSSLMMTKSQQSNFKETTGSMFSRVTEWSKMIPEKTLKRLEREPELKFSADVLHQRMKSRLVTDPETSKALILNIQKKLLEKRRKEISRSKLEKSKSKKRTNDKKIALKNPKEKLFQKGSKRISIDDRDRFIQTISKIKTRNANLTQ